jgi:peptidoglycan LD-endopeptidase CwlK
MYKFSRKSKAKLETCHPDLQRVFNEAIKHVDFTILEGIRSLERQQELVRSGASKTLNSMHIEKPDGTSHAVDAIAYPIQWDNYNRNYLFAGFIKGIAAGMGIKLRLGSDWNGDFDTTDQSFHDLPHFELEKK